MTELTPERKTVLAARAKLRRVMARLREAHARGMPADLQLAIAELESADDDLNGRKPN